MSGIDHLLAVAHAYAESQGVGLSTVSWRVFGDTKKLASIESGADIQVRRYERALQWFSDNWPPDKSWPKGFRRPDPHLAEAS